MKIYKVILAVLLVIFSTNISLPQGNEGRSKYGNAIDSLMKQKLIENLGFDESAANKFISVYDENNKQIRMIMKEKKSLMESIEQDIEAKDMDTKINKLIELEANILDKRKSFFEEIRKFLTPQQIAKTLILRKQLSKQIRTEINDRKKKGIKKEKSESN